MNAVSAVILRKKGQIVPFKPQDWPPTFLGGYTTHRAQHGIVHCLYLPEMNHNK